MNERKNASAGAIVVAAFAIALLSGAIPTGSVQFHSATLPGVPGFRAETLVNSTPWFQGAVPKVLDGHATTIWANIVTPEDRQSPFEQVQQNWQVGIWAVSPQAIGGGFQVTSVGFTVNDTGFFTPYWESEPIDSATGCADMGIATPNNHGPANNGTAGFTLNRYMEYNFTMTLATNQTWMTYRAVAPNGTAVWTYENRTIKLNTLKFSETTFDCSYTSSATDYNHTMAGEYVTSVNDEHHPLWSFDFVSVGYRNSSTNANQPASWAGVNTTATPAVVSTQPCKFLWSSGCKGFIVANEHGAVFFGTNYDPQTPSNYGSGCWECAVSFVHGGSTKVIFVEYSLGAIYANGSYYPYHMTSVGFWNTNSAYPMCYSTCGVNVTGMYVIQSNITITDPVIETALAGMTVYYSTNGNDFTDVVITVNSE